MRHTYSEYAAVFKALSDETRIKIVEFLCHKSHCANDLLKHFNITQPTLSYHMRILNDCGLVCSKKCGCFLIYSLNPEKAVMVRCFLEDIGPEAIKELFC